MCHKCSRVAHPECTHPCDLSELLSVKFQPTLGTLQGNVRKTVKWEHFERTCSFPIVGWNCAESGSLRLQGGYIQDVPLGNICDTPLWFILGFTNWEHCGRTTGETSKKTLNEPPRNTERTFPGIISSVPNVFLMGTPQSHDWEHCECTGCFTS